jgi:hypothetical protein
VKNLFICGCSFLSDDTKYPSQPTFLQQFAQRNSFNYHCLARPGATNYMIRLQIDHAIKRKADFIIVGATSSDRLNIVVDQLGWRAPLAIQHFDYNGYDCSSEHEFKDQSFIIGDTIANLLEDRYTAIEQTTKDAIKSYVAELHDIGLQYHMDLCIVRDGIRKLLDSNIPFIFIPGPTTPEQWLWTGNHLWPKDKPQPWDMPHGGATIGNHNPPEAHAMFLETLEQIAFDKGILEK